MFHKTLVFLGIFLFSTTVFPVQSRNIKHIVFHGLHHASQLAVVKKIILNQYKYISSKDISNIVKELFNTNYFSDISVKKTKESFFFYVKERPEIKEIIFSGNKILLNSVLYKALHKFDISEHHPFNDINFNSFLFFLKKYYFDRGIFNAQIKPVCVKSSDNSVSINIDINEDPFFKLSDIKIIGNKNYSSHCILKKFFQFNKYSLLNFFVQKKYTFHDLQKSLLDLKNFYKDNGYLKVKVNRLKVFENKENKNFSILVDLNEGKKYTFNKIITYKIKSPSLNKNSDIQYIYKPDSSFKESDISELKRNIKKSYAKKGFSCAKVFVHHDFNDTNQSVILYIVVKPKQQFFINKIYFSGHTKSNYKFLKNIIKPLKHSYFDKYSINKNCQLLKNTNLFHKVSASVYKIKNLNNAVNVCYTLEDYNNNQLVCSAGYDLKTGILLRLLYFDKNVLGLGYTVYSKIAKNLNLTRANMYFSKSFHSLRDLTWKFRFFYNSIKKPDFNVSQYIDRYYGVESSIISPVVNNKKFSVSIGNRVTRLPDFSPQFSLIKYINDFRDNLKTHHQVLKDFSVRDYFLKYLFDYNNMQQENLVKTGNRIKFKGKFTLPFSDNKFHKMTLSSENFIPLENTKKFILHIYSVLGIGLQFGKNMFPMYNKYYSGFKRSIRGFKNKSLNPKEIDYNFKDSNFKKDPKDNHPIINEFKDSINGNCIINTNMELLFPHIDLHSSLLGYLQYGIFLDTVNIWDGSLQYILNTLTHVHIKKSYNPNEIYMSTGAFFRWFSSFGPITATFSIPILYNNISDNDILKFHIDFNKN